MSENARSILFLNRASSYRRHGQIHLAAAWLTHARGMRRMAQGIRLEGRQDSPMRRMVSMSKYNPNWIR